ncbi:Centromere protein P [Stylophora pistillata]|uniref:Centromere protein P n=2 Tax=Stylophora pistillata TaxID=50429 RepID=A0A2B4RUK6_STYPI|nr:Centromere protein P [Stylophora pistillata]
MVLLQRLSGTCHRIPFTVEFEVKEKGIMDSLLSSKDAECLKDRVVELTRLRVSVTDHLAEQELAQFLEKVQEDKSLQPFFFGLIQYAEWHSNRQRTFGHFKMKYPEIVHFSNTSSTSQCLKLYNRNKPGLVFTLLWKLVIGESGHVTSDVQIHASVPVKHADQRDKYSLLRNVPKQFHKVLPFLGIEQAVEVVIGMLCR